jgi:5-methyltetrahydrofolate--homocysteine methyltransferase
MADNIQQRVAAGPPLLFDGAIGSRLIQMGLPAGEAPEAWIITHPESVLEVHREYVRAGCDVITTCTFGGNRLRLSKGGLNARLEEINRRAVQLAKEAASGHNLIAGGMGPSGEFFQPHGSLTEAEASAVYEEQAGVLAAEGVDFFLLETHYDLREACLGFEACRKVTPQVPVAVTLTFNSTPRGYFTVMGDAVIDALQTLSATGAFLVGANCTLEAEGMAALSQQLIPELNVPLLFQANAGTPQITADGVIYPQKPDEFMRYAGEMLGAGARAVGGCCGSDASHIQALRAMIDNKFGTRNQ